MQCHGTLLKHYPKVYYFFIIIIFYVTITYKKFCKCISQRHKDKNAETYDRVTKIEQSCCSLVDKEIQWRSNGDPMEIQWRSNASQPRLNDCCDDCVVCA